MPKQLISLQLIDHFPILIHSLHQEYLKHLTHDILSLFYILFNSISWTMPMFTNEMGVLIIRLRYTETKKLSTKESSVEQQIPSIGKAREAPVAAIQAIVEAI